MAKWTCAAIRLVELVRVVQSSHHAPRDDYMIIEFRYEPGPSHRRCLKCHDARAGRMMMEQSLASLDTRERDDYFGRSVRNRGVKTD